MGDETYPGFDRVSAILDAYQAPELIDWKIRVGKKEANRISRVATNCGTNVDEFIRALISGEKKPKLKSPESENCVRAFDKWVVDYGVNVKDLSSGTRLFNEKTKVCGEPDLLWESKSMVVDIKCSSAIRQSYILQTEWYARELKFTKKAILRLDKNLSMYEYEVMDISDKDLEAFEALTKVYRFFKKKSVYENLSN